MIIDVREINEFEQEHIPGSINIPLSSFSPYAFPTPSFAEEKVILICRTNKRSNVAKEILLKLEIFQKSQLIVYEPGVLGWIKNGRPKNLL